MKSRARSSAEPRLAAARVLTEVMRGRSLSDCLQPGTERLGAADRALAAELAQGACRWYPQLAFVIDRLVERPLKKRDRDLGALLAVGLYQLMHTRVPPHAAVAETVAAVRGLRKDWARGLVNGVLRRFLREHEALRVAIDADPEAKWAMPGWLLERLQADWPDDWQRLVAALNERPPLTLRINLSRQSREACVAELADSGHRAAVVSDVPSALQLAEPAPVAALPGFAEGRISVQDAGAQLAAPWLDLRPGQAVLDVCAAPGGKTGHLLECEPDIALTAVDVSAQRMQRVAENLARLGVGAELVVDDAAHPSGDWAARRYDRILIDAPCSATGVLRRHPDIRLLRRADDIDALAVRQSAILEAVWPLLQPGGKLLYVTCSVLSQENESRVEAFQSMNDSAVIHELPGGPGVTRGPGRQLLPTAGGSDGFFYALLGRAA